jgi:CHAT domain-containing protein/tetratricopeptide (TPR) repeat protein
VVQFHSLPVNLVVTQVDLMVLVRAILYMVIVLTLWTPYAQGTLVRREHQLSSSSQADALFEEALLSADAGDIKSARLGLERAMDLWIRAREPGKAAHAAVQLGDRYRNRRQYQAALNLYQLANNVKSISAPVKANVLNAVARIYEELFIDDLAEHYFNQALRQEVGTNDPSSKIVSLTGLADISRRRGSLEKASALIRQALVLSKSTDVSTNAALLYSKGEVCQQRGSNQCAKESFAEALSIYQGNGSVEGQVKMLCALSTLSLLDQRKDEALEQAEQAVDMAEKEGKRAVSLVDQINAAELRWWAWLRRARAQRALGQDIAALNSYKFAIGHFEGAWSGSYKATESTSVAAREQAQAPYREFVDLLLKLGRVNPAFDLADQAKARTLLTFREARRANPTSDNNEQVPAQRELARSIVQLRLQLQSSGLRGEQREKLQKDLKAAEYKMEEGRLEADLAHSQERLVKSRLAYAEDLKLEMRREKTLIEFSLGEDRSFLWLFTRGELFFQILPARKEIENAVRAYINLLSAPPSPLHIERDLTNFRNQSEALFGTLFGSLAARIEPGQKLVIVPDGLLYCLPFETLISDGHYLVETHEVSYLPAASFLMQPEKTRSKVPAQDRMELLAFGDPVFSPTSKRVIPRKARTTPIDVSQNVRAAQRLQFTSLPRTRDEVQYIANLFSKDQTRLYLGKDSTESSFKREQLLRYRRLHFATHTVIDELSPSRSAVVLTQGADTDEDGFLEVDEISELALDCDLVVLSGCQTGRGQVLTGEGILGLSRAFMYAGAKSVVVSLWNVSDISTCHLMETFYSHLRSGMSIVKSLRETKLEMLNGHSETRHPYYWAPFVVIGKP